MKQIEVGIEKPVLEVKDNRLLIISGEELISEYVEKFLLQSLPKLPKDGINAIKSYLTSEEVLANVSSHLGTKEIILSAVIMKAKCFTTNIILSFVDYIKGFECVMNKI